MNNKNLILTKTYDFCTAKTPRLTVVLIHGIASDSSTFEPFLEYCRNTKSLDEVRFVTFDLLGSGKSLKSDDLNYDYHDQLTALKHAIEALDVNTPLILAGHSLGTFIVTRYASKYASSLSKLILISAPIYTLKDLENPAFEMAIKAFRDVVSVKNHKIVQEKSFINSMDKIVLNKDNYDTLINIAVPTTLIYGIEDQLIASYNIPSVVEHNPSIFTAIKTVGRHGVTKEKFAKIREAIEEVLNA